MYFYKSVSDFRHSIFLQGKKYIISPGEVFQSATKLSYLFLEEVKDNTPVSKLREATSSLNTIQSKLNSLEEENKGSIKVDIVENLRDDIRKLQAQISDLRSDYEKDRDSTIRRLGILKEATQSLENEIYGSPEVESPPIPK